MEDIAFRYIAANNGPDHATIARFRADHQELLGELFTQALRLCVEAGLGKVGLVALDGTRVKASASIQANKTKDAIEEEVKKILEEAAAIDAAEDQIHGEKQGDELPEELSSASSRLARLRQAKQRLEKEEQQRQAADQQKQKDREQKETELGHRLRGRKPKPKKPERPPQANITDPDSRILKSAHWFVQGYNAQARLRGSDRAGRRPHQRDQRRRSTSPDAQPSNLQSRDRGEFGEGRCSGGRRRLLQ